MNKYKTSDLFIVVSFICYFLLSFVVQRQQTTFLLGIIIILFISYFLILFQANKKDLKTMLYVAIFFRLVFLFSIPALSDDYFRFIWDGTLLVHGHNPFGFLPKEVIPNGWLENTTYHQDLIQKMNSPNYYSVYPPVLQFIFFMAAKFSFGSNFLAIVIMRIFIISAEIGTLYFIKKIAAHLNLNPLKAIIYWINPLVIIEFSGNLHFEGIMIFFAAMAFYYLLKERLYLSAIFFALSVSTKLIPLILLPVIINKVGLKKGFVYSTIVFAITILLFSGFINQQIIYNISDSLGLYFQTFEFNASIYYLLRWVGYQFYNYNLISVIGKILPAMACLIIVYISFKTKKTDINNSDLFKKMLSVLFIYYLAALIVHPWYIGFLLMVAVFTNASYVIIWTAVIFLTYATFASIPYQENLYFVFLEYAIVLFIFYLNKKGKLLQNIFPNLN